MAVQFIYGTQGDDTLEGTNGSDAIHGYSENGNPNNDGNDTLFGGAGNDTLDCGGGSNEFDGGDGNDTVILRGLGGMLGFTGSGLDTIVNMSDHRVAGFVLGDDMEFYRGSHYRDIVDVTDPSLAVARGFTGNKGDDELRSGAGRDRLDGGLGHDLLDGRGANDQLLAGAGNDSVFGGTGADTLFGGQEKDQLSGGDGGDLIHGEGGKDRLDGGSGNDNLSGGPDVDNFIFAPGSGRDRVQDFADANGASDDRLDVSAYDFASIGDITFEASGNDAVLRLTSGNTITLTNYLAAHSLADIGADDIII